MYYQKRTLFTFSVVTTEALKESGALCKIYIALNGDCGNNLRCVVEDGTPECV